MVQCHDSMKDEKHLHAYGKLFHKIHKFLDILSLNRNSILITDYQSNYMCLISFMNVPRAKHFEFDIQPKQNTSHNIKMTSR